MNGTGKLKNGVGQITLPKERAPGTVSIKFPGETRSIEARLRQTDQNTISIESYFNSTPLYEDLVYEWFYQPVKHKELLKEDPNLQPKLVSAMKFNLGPDAAYLDFGFVPPFVNQNNLPEHSVDVHTRLMMPIQMLEALHMGLSQALEAIKKAKANG